MPILAAHPSSNLAWRILMEFDRPADVAKLLPQALAEGKGLFALLPEDYQAECLRQAEAWVAPEPTALPAIDASRPLVKFTSYEGSKGLSAHSVFVLGLHEGGLPAKAGGIRDIEIRKFLVALTRTRMQCHLLFSQRARNGKDLQSPSPFIQWIGATRKQPLRVSSRYWKASELRSYSA